MPKKNSVLDAMRTGTKFESLKLQNTRCAYCEEKLPKHKKKCRMHKGGWEEKLYTGIEALLDHFGHVIADEHLEHTPARVVRMYKEMFSGVGVPPASVLGTQFEEDSYNQLIIVSDIEFISMCAHHLLPFTGRVNFGYLPDKNVIGLSKIPRLVEVLARRPQIQERLTEEIADMFQIHVKPKGCIVAVEGWHACVAARGVKKPGTMMSTTALRGEFVESKTLKEEFFLTLSQRTRTK